MGWRSRGCHKNESRVSLIPAAAEMRKEGRLAVIMVTRIASSHLRMLRQRCAESILVTRVPALNAIFGSPDDLKNRSSMTLFTAAAGPGEALYLRNIDRRLGSRRDARTLDLLPREES